MKITGKRIFTAITLVLAVITVYQVLSRPEPIAEPQTAQSATANTQSFEQKLAQLEAPRTDGNAPAEAHFSSEEVSAEMAQSLSTPPVSPRPASSTSTSPDAAVAPAR